MIHTMTSKKTKKTWEVSKRRTELSLWQPMWHWRREGDSDWELAWTKHGTGRWPLERLADIRRELNAN